MQSQIQYTIAGPARSQADAGLATVQTALDTEVFTETFVAGQQLSFEAAYVTTLMPSHVAARA
jgi:hypothetical protein